MNSGVEIPEWAVSPRPLLYVTGMGIGQCAQLLAAPAITPETLEALTQNANASGCRAAATSPNAPGDLLRNCFLSLDVDRRVRLAGEANLGVDVQRELSSATAERVRDCPLRNEQLDPAIATMMRRRPHLGLPKPT